MFLQQIFFFCTYFFFFSIAIQLWIIILDLLNILFYSRFSSKSKSVDKSDEELQFPKELMEDWSTMEVCVDCKKFISEIISSSRRSLVLANKRARLKRKTQSFYMSSAGPSEYCPSERTINEIWALCLSVAFVFSVGASTGEHGAGLSLLAVGFS